MMQSFAESSRFDHRASLKPDRLQISVLTWLFQRRASCLGEVCKFRDLRAQIQRELPFSSPAKQLWEKLAGFGTQATLEAMTEGVGRKDAKDRDRRWVPRFAKVWDRFSRRIHCLFFFFFLLRDRIEQRLPRPGLPTEYLATAGALEVMSTNRCCREMFLLLNCSKHVSVFLALRMFWCAHKLYRQALGLRRVGEN